MTPLLSICIPTYKRPVYLKRCLESIKIQLADDPKLSKIVEVVVSDNCSQDNTPNVVEEYKKYFPNIKYVVTEKNIGFDLNIYNLIKNSSGRYCWYLGDDDVIVNGGISFLCSQLITDKYDYVGVQSEHFSPQNNYTEKREVSEKLLVEIDNFNDCYFGNYFQGAVSVLIFNRGMWMSCVNKDDFIKHWLYYETVAKILLATKRKMLYISQPIIFTGQDCRWSENGTELFTYINSNILREKMMKLGFDRQKLSKDLGENKKRLLLILAQAKGHGLDCNLENLKFIYKNSGSSCGYLFGATLIYFLPNKLIILIRDLRKRLLK